MRVSSSLSGSFMAMVRSSSPTRLQQARDQALGAEIPQRDARQFVLAVIGARPASQFAAIADASGGRIARQLGELQRRGKALLHRFRSVAGNRLQPSPAAGKLLRHPAAPVVLLDRTLLRHLGLLAVPRLRFFTLT